MTLGAYSRFVFTLSLDVGSLLRARFSLSLLNA